jgi:hypothetical protein
MCIFMEHPGSAMENQCDSRNMIEIDSMMEVIDGFGLMHSILSRLG